MPNDNEENKKGSSESFSVDSERVEGQETVPAGGAIDREAEKRAAKIGEQELGEPMAGWDVIAYLEEFYPELIKDIALKIMQDIEDAEQVEPMQIMKDGEKAEIMKSIIDISVIKEKMLREAAVLSKKTLEFLENCSIFDFILRKVLPAILKDYPDDHLNILDVGGGPTIYQHILLNGVSDSIIHGEYLKANREEVEKWKAGKSQFDWTSYFSVYQAYLQSHPNTSSNASAKVNARFQTIAREDTTALQDELRGKITVVPIDVGLEDLGIKEETPPDVVHIGKEGSLGLITSNFCIESIKDDRLFWENGIGNSCRKVPENGFLVMTAIRHANWYKVGEEKISATSVDANSISTELEKRGFEIQIISELVGSDKEVVGYDGMVFVLAKRIVKQ